MSDLRYAAFTQECIVLLSRQFNIDEPTLNQLNCTQLSQLDVNVNQDGQQTLAILPAVETEQERIPLPTGFEVLHGSNDTCSTSPEYSDILYVPAHPKTGKKTWYAISEEAKEKINQERATLAAAVVENDTQATLNNLEKLGLLSKFSAKLHEQFMTAEQQEQYRALIAVKKVIELDAHSADEATPNAWLLKVVEDFDLGIRYPAARTPASVKRANARLTSRVRRSVEKKIKDLEKTAERAARQSTADDGSRFVFDQRLEYFTSTQQQALANSVAMLYKNRRNEQALMFAQDGRRYLEQWPEQLKQTYQDFIRSHELSFAEKETLVAKQNEFVCATHLRLLNAAGLAILEQCLSLEQLEGSRGVSQGPNILAKQPWRNAQYVLPINDTKLIDDLYQEVQGQVYDRPDVTPEQITGLITNTSIAGWSYYPAKALIAIMDNSIETHKGRLSQVIGTHVDNTPLGEMFKKLLWVKKLALARVAHLIDLAKKNAHDNKLRFTLFNEDEKAKWPASLTLIEDEANFTPSQKSNPGFKNLAEFNDIQVVECCLLSEGDVFYLRGPWWYFPEQSNDRYDWCAASHVKDITRQLAFNDPSHSGEDTVKAETVAQAMKALTETKATIELSEISKSFDTVFWQDAYHYQSGLGPNGEQPLYTADAGIQFLRFSSKAEGQLNSQHTVAQPLMLGGEGKLSASLTVLQGQLSVGAWLPLQPNQGLTKENKKDVKGQPLNIRYFDNQWQELSYSAGELFAYLEGSVYGLAAATCQLSTDIRFGPSDQREGIGIKGSAVGLFDANIHEAYLLPGTTLQSVERAPLAGQAKAEVDVFAGVQAGGVLSISVYWLPPPPSRRPATVKKLGSVKGELAGSFGVGAHAGFRLIVQGGLLVVEASAAWALGPGCKGGVAIGVDAFAADEFIGCLLGALKQSGFRQLAVFGEAGDNGINDSFMMLNDILTFAVGMGLTVSQALLMPVTSWSDYRQQVMSREYAPVLAKHIIDPETQTTTQRWIVSLPPESLSNLLKSLVQRQNRNIDQINTALSLNQSQAQAIVQIMQWLAADTRQGEENSQRQWKETLIRMSLNPAAEAEKNSPEEWAAYLHSWQQLAELVKAFDNTTNKQMISDFNRTSQTLSRNMIVSRFEIVEHINMFWGATERKVAQYRAHPISEVANPAPQAGQPLRLHSGSEHPNETIVNWSIYDLLP
ncbi:LysM domain-containing protein [Vibrio metschnikovii]|uniref:LysM domain-containing protein n=1 Tax=Vibrio metschnikovii TaxID=28172 RepID=UPI001644FF2F|nr:LysM domain-containing protein [Vibrio metschnikovii]MBC3618545.1 LysM domain-containing protein [Vibrio metschnikovii]MBC5814536.1 LysM domain-containing protein [Vibrio metschnikovii]